MTVEDEAGVASEVEGGTTIDVEEAGAGLSETGFTAGSKEELKLQEELCWVAEWVGGRIVRAGGHLDHRRYNWVSGVRQRRSSAVVLFIVGMDFDRGKVRQG